VGSGTRPTQKQFFLKKKKKTIENFDTGGRFVTGVIDTGGAPSAANISTNF
jgi:hypothetical protein